MMIDMIIDDYYDINIITRSEDNDEKMHRKKLDVKITLNILDVKNKIQTCRCYLIFCCINQQFLL